MSRRLAIASFAILSLAAALPARAQTLITTTWVYFRRSPSKTGPKIRTLIPAETLTVRPVPPPAHTGWRAVRDGDGKAGWVASAYVREIAGPVVAPGGATPPGGATVPGAAHGSATTIVLAAGGGAESSIDATWDKPPIGTSTIRMQNGTLSCGPQGDGTDDGTNLHKNRVDLPAASRLVTVDAIRSLPDTALWRFKNRAHWTHADSLLVIPYEGIAVVVEGYFEIVKPQATSAPTPPAKVGEAPNCHSWDERDTDWHIALVADPSEHEERSVVVEPTPRTKRANPGWTSAAAKALAVRHSPGDTRHEAAAAKVRVTGFLMLDPVHPDHISGACTGAQCATKKFFRATLWEVHPVTRIEVWKVDKWVDLNDLPPP